MLDMGWHVSVHSVLIMPCGFQIAQIRLKLAWVVKLSLEG